MVHATTVKLVTGTLREICVASILSKLTILL